MRLCPKSAISYRRVSIHASVKDATIKISAYPFRAYVSIHASVKDATCKGVNFFTSPYCFNPRICKRCDVSNCFSSLFLSCFNPRICKRCDRRILPVIFFVKRFNPRICKRCDRFSTSEYLNDVFQSTHL